MARSQVTALRRPMLGLLKLNRSVMFKPHRGHLQVRSKCDSPVKGLVVGLYVKEGEKDPKLSLGGEQLDDRVGGKLSELIKEMNLTGVLATGRLFYNLDKEFNCVAVVGLGKEGYGYVHEEAMDVGMENVRICAGAGARALQLQGCDVVHVDALDFPEQAAEGAAMAVWRNNKNKRKNQRILIPKLELYGSQDTDSWTRGLFKAESQNLARRLSDTPANQMTPTIFAQAATDSLCPCGVSVEVRTLDWIEAQNLNSFLMVAKGSCEQPMMLEISYCGASAEDKPILLVGKGMTFNTGGLCLKPKEGMDEHRGSMSGAAVVVAAIRAAAALSLPINVTGIIPLCEHMPSGMSVKPGDVVTLLNGKSLGIKDTNLAGTVLLADPLLYGQATYKPKLLVDVAALNVASRIGLGACGTALYTNSTTLWKQFKKAGSLTGDRMWRMPLWKYFRYLVLPNLTYDLCNKGRGMASACLSAALLHQLIPCVDWVHLDNHGTGMLSLHGVPPYLLKNCMSGRPTRTIIQFLYQLGCK